MFEDAGERDSISEKLLGLSQNILAVVFGLLPLFFLPISAAPFEYTKTFFVLIGVICALVLFSLSVLRSGKVAITFSYSLLALWVVVIVVFVSAMLSGDLHDALVGDQFSIQSSAFVALLALSATIWSLVQVRRAVIMRLYVLLSFSTIVLVGLHITRLLFGSDILSFGIFQKPDSSLVGGWNDLGLFLGLAILLSLVAIELLRLKQAGKILFGLVTVLSLAMLTIINFYAIWLLLGLVSLVVLVYTLSKDRLTTLKRPLIKEKMTNVSSLTLSLLVCVVSVLFIIAGPALGGWIQDHTRVSFIEVRPSVLATTNIARSVYAEHPLLGIGANRFSDAWRLYKDVGINTTVFWNTDFNAGNGYITTFFVTTGVLGGLAWAVFLVVFIYTGIRNLIRAPEPDRIWYFIGTSSFVSAVYIWIMSVVYVPGSVMLLLGAMCTGLSIASAQALGSEKITEMSIGSNRRTGFIFTLVIIAVIIGSVQTLYATSQHYAAAYTFNKAREISKTDFNAIEATINRASDYSNSDLFARSIAEHELTRINTLLVTESPTVAQQQEFQAALVNGVNAGQSAKQSDDTEPANWAVLGDIYSILVAANIEGSYDRAFEALSKARDLDPKNPSRYLALAQLTARANDLAASREYTQKAIALKADYSDALFFLTQLDIVSGNVEGAVKSAQAIIALEPQNPARYYQLGILESSRKNINAAIAAFEQAVRLDPNYANALYFLALGYDATGRSAQARKLFERVLLLNPGNEKVTSLIDAIDTRGKTGVSLGDNVSQVTVDGPVITKDNDKITTTEDPDSSLVSPVNTAPSPEESTATQEPIANEVINQQEESIDE